MEDDPDGRGPLGGEAGRGRGALGRAGPGGGNGPANIGFLGHGEKRKEKKWVGLKEREKEK